MLPGAGKRERRPVAEAPLLVLDTATRTPVVALASRDATVLGERRWESRHRHGERLLEELDSVLRETGTAKRELGGVIVGTGPGSFTGLRIGLATAKVIAYSLSVPIVGVSTTRALALAAANAAAAGESIAVTLPAGSVDRYLHRLTVRDALLEEVDPPRLVAGAHDFAQAVAGATIVAVDLDDDEVPAEPGRRALAGLAAALARLGIQALEAGRPSDPETLVPAYVALPRGIATAAAEMEWSPDLR